MAGNLLVLPPPLCSNSITIVIQDMKISWSDCFKARFKVLEANLGSHEYRIIDIPSKMFPQIVRRNGTSDRISRIHAYQNIVGDSWSTTAFRIPEMVSVNFCMV